MTTAKQQTAPTQDKLATAALDPATKQIMVKIANTIRQLSMEAVQQANSGHPGMPMGCAELGAYLYGHALQHNPKNSHWLNRDRLVLSAGHGSMWLYSCLHLSGFDLSMEDIKNFRQLHSRTPGHPENTDTDGVETTTGPLGQGIGVAVGMALASKVLGARFNRPGYDLFDSKVYCVAGDGCIMEGISSEVSSLAGHLCLDNLILVYDANMVSLDGPLPDSCSEDTKMRYRAYGWDVYEVDGADLDAIHRIFTQARQNQKRPVLIVAHTVIGRGAPNKAGTYKVHGSPLGEDEIKAAKAFLRLPDEKFFVPQEVYAYFQKKLAGEAAKEKAWNELREVWSRQYPDLAKELMKRQEDEIPKDLEQQLNQLEIVSPVASRTASQQVLQLLADQVPQLIGGSADLSHSDMTMLKKYPIIAPGNFAGRNLKYGVREFGMATIANGLAQTGLFRPFIGTFLTFSDYMRNAIRLAALSRAKVIYQFTHDSIFLGEDGPTHQPIEHFASLRAMPQLWVIRPADANEVKMAWLAALHHTGPVAIILSRQNLPDLKVTHVPYAQGLVRGAYIVRREKKKPDYTLLATGSEVSLALDVASALEKRGKDVRVVSMPCWEIYEQQPAEYKNSVLGGDLGKRVSIEVGVAQGWHRYIGMDGIAICMDRFGASAPASALVKEFGFTVESILDRIL